MIKRQLADELVARARTYPVVTVLGPRQAGKTTLVRATFPGYDYVNLENPETRAFAESDPKSFLARHPDRLVIDEVQRVPGLLSWIQVLVDETPGNGRFILTGSNQPELGQAVSQSLAGRTSLLYLLPLSLEELAAHGASLDRDDCLVRGFLPRVRQENQEPGQAYLDYLSTYVERDMRRLVNVRDLSKFETFLRLLAGRVGQILNASSLSADVGLSATTIASWISILEASFIVFRVQPYHANIGKRLVKSPKLYFYEPGLVAALLQVETPDQASRDPLLGGMFENMVMVELRKALWNRGRRDTITYYRDSAGMEVDAIVERQRIPLAIEMKASRTFDADFPRNLRKFMALQPSTSSLHVVYGGSDRLVGSDYALWGFAEAGRILTEAFPPYSEAAAL